MPFQPLGGGAMSMPTIQGPPTVNPMAGLSQIMQLVSMASLLQNRAQQQEMNQMRMAMWQQQMEDGKTEADKKRILRDRYLKDYAMRVVTNPDFRTEYSNVLRLSPGRQEKEFEKLRNKYIEPLKYNYDNTIIKPKDVYDYLLYDKILDARQKAQAIDDSRWSGFWDSIVADAAHLGASAANIIPGLDARGLAQWATEQKQKAVAKNLWLQDQERRAQQGEGFLDQSLPDMARTIAGSLPTLAGYFGATAAGTAVGGPFGAAAATGALGGAMSDIDYATAINSSQLSEADKEAAMGGFERYGNAAAGTIFGALAPSIARPYRFVRGALSKSYTPMALPTSRLAAIARQGIDTAAGMGLMGAGQQAASNVALGSALNQNIPWYRGILDAAAQGAIPGLLMGGYFGRRNPIQPPTGSPTDSLRFSNPDTTPPTNNSGGPGENIKVPPKKTNATPKEETSVPENAEASVNARMQTLTDLFNASKDTDVQYFNQLRAKETPIDAILADENVAPHIKKLLSFDSSQEPAIEIKDGAIKSLAKTKSDEMVKNKIISLLSREIKNEGAPAEKAMLVKTKYDRLQEKLATPEQYGFDTEQAARLSKLADTAYQELLKTRGLETEGALIEYGEAARQEAAQTQQKGGGTDTGSDIPTDSGTPADTGATPPESTVGATPGPGEDHIPTESGVADGTPPPTDGTNQTPNGDNQREGTPTGGDTSGRIGEPTDGSPQADAGAGEPNAQTREQPGGSQSESGLSGSDADRINMYRRVWAENDVDNSAASKVIGDAVRNDDGDPAWASWRADMRMIYRKVDESPFNNTEQKLADLPEAEQDAIIKTYLDAYDEKETAENAIPTDPVC